MAARSVGLGATDHGITSPVAWGVRLFDVADTISRILEPKGIGVWMGGVHLCMVMRGVEQESSFMETNVLRGEFRDDERTRQEFMSIVNRRGARS